MIKLNPAFRVALFDADGVMVQSPVLFSEVYAKKHGLDPKSFGAFFKGDYRLAQTGKADLKKLIMQHADTWHYSSNPDQLLNEWFEAENYPNHALVTLIRDVLRPRGLFCALVTNHEKYRAANLRDKLFANVFDRVFSAAELGVMKPKPEFFKAVLKHPSIAGLITTPAQVAYFDDEQSNVDAAKAIGIQAFHYQNAQQVEELLLSPTPSAKSV